MGTVTAPRLRIARSAMDHSGLFSEMSATRSFARIPRSARPSAIWRTRRTKSAAEMLTHCPSRLSLTASGLSCRAMAARHTPANVDGMLDSSWPGETLAAAAEDTGKRSPSIGQSYDSKLPDRERAEHRLHRLQEKIQPNSGWCNEAQEDFQAVFASSRSGGGATSDFSSALRER